MARLVWSERAQQDLEGIVNHVALDSPIHAKQVSKRAVLRAFHLPEQPKQGRCLPEYEGP